MVSNILKYFKTKRGEDTNGHTVHRELVITKEQNKQNTAAFLIEQEL